MLGAKVNDASDILTQHLLLQVICAVDYVSIVQHKLASATLFAGYRTMQQIITACLLCLAKSEHDLLSAADTDRRS